jgi:hypothetical protein
MYGIFTVSFSVKDLNIVSGHNPNMVWFFHRGPTQRGWMAVAFVKLVRMPNLGIMCQSGPRARLVLGYYRE